ncbi:MAG: hypothetical protein K8R54_07050 [Bacteroidales bacterium]|nr:hypothetical protein [Bacteroidales bacterium]
MLSPLSSQNNNDKKVIITEIKIEGNKKTKVETILRELTFKKDDSISFSELEIEIEKSKKNLLNKPLFNYVEIEIETGIEKEIIINITVEERWYLWPEVAVYYIDRNFSNWLKEKDLSRIDIGIGLVKYNFRGRNEKLTFYTFFGYDEELLLKYDNLYIDKKRIHSLSFYNEIKRRKETGCIIENDKLMQIRLEDEYVLKSVRASMTYAYRKKYYNSHSFTLAFENRSVSDSLLLCNQNYFTNDLNYTNYFRLKYVFLRDKRNLRVFPVEGHKIELTLAKNGLFIFPESNINSFYLKSDLSLYTKITDRISLNNNLTFKKTLGSRNPFFLNTSLGYTSSIRGYEYYAVNGRDLILTKNTLNFKILPKKIFHLKFLPWEKFNKIHFTIYASVFADAAYVTNNDIEYMQLNNLQNTWLYSGGIGLNFLTYYDKLLRVEYSFNKQEQGGFYLHFEAPF